MVEWLAPIALFWTVAALYLGGFRLEIRGGGGFRQFLGVFDTFVLYLVVWWLIHWLLRGALGAVGSIAAACIIATVFLPILSRVGFGILGVRITKASAQH